MTQWYFTQDGTQHGPVSEEVLKAKLGSGELLPTELVWRDGMDAWRPASAFPELIPEAPPAPAPDGGSPYQPPSSMMKQPPPGMLPAPPPEGAGKATASMVLGICGLVGWCIPCIGLILGILAVVFGGQVIDAADLRPELEPHLGKARSGRTMGIITIILSVINSVAGVIIRMNQG